MGELLIIILILLVLNLITAFTITNLSMKYYKKSSDTIKSYTRFSKWVKIIHGFVRLMTFLALFIKINLMIDGYYLFVFLFSSFVSFLMMLLCSFIYYKVEKVIKHVNKDYFKHFFRLTLFKLLIMIPLLLYCLFIYFIILGSVKDDVTELIWFLLSGVSLALLFIVAKNNIKILKKVLRVKPLDDEMLYNELKDILNKQGYEEVEILKFETTGIKHANALVYGTKKKQTIFIADYLYQNLPMNQVKALILHEIGHIKLGHLVKNSKTASLGIVSMFLAGGISLIVMSFFTVFNNEFYTLLVFIGVVITTNMISKFLRVKRLRRNEHEADLYMIKNGSSFEDARDALMSLGSLNYISIDELMLFSTHPSIQQRIKYLQDMN